MLLQELNGRLIAMQEIADVAGELGMEAGLLWDQTKGVGARTDLATLRRMADYLKNNEGVRRLCELLGRMRRYSASQRLETIKSMTKYAETVYDREAKSEIVGITQGRDIEHILPQELALLADPDTEILFDLKFAEGRLMSFDYAGMIQKSYEMEQEETKQVEEEDKLGPMIICVDTSGSMSGEPENVAKAIALTLAMKSMEQKRACYLISFSTTIVSRDLTKDRGLPKLLEFLQMSFGGGTSGAPALHHGLKMMKEESYERADLLMISDFDMPDITPELKQQMQEARERKCKFYALNIGAISGQTMRHVDFDDEWQYDPHTMGIKELTGIVNRTST
ncbi:MAG: VWA domain-containing protein [Desulfuromonadaceae bacterium]